MHSQIEVSYDPFLLLAHDVISPIPPSSANTSVRPYPTIKIIKHDVVSRNPQAERKGIMYV